MDPPVHEVLNVAASRIGINSTSVPPTRDSGAAISLAADIQAEAEGMADIMTELGESLTDADSGALRESFRRMVSKITCQWEKVAPKTPKGRVKNLLIGGEVELKPSPFVVRTGTVTPAS